MPAAASAPDAGPVDATLRGLRGMVADTRRRLRWSWVGTGAGLALGLGAVALLAAAGCDIALGLPDAARWVAFAALVGVAGTLLAQRVVRPLCARLTTVGTALRIEKTVPDMHNRLVTALDLERQERPPETEPFFRLIVRQAQERLQGFRAANVLDLGSLKRAAAWAAGPLALLALGWTLAPRFVPPAVQRVLMPWADIAPPSWLTLAVGPETSDVLRGEAGEIAVTVDGGEPDSVRLQATNAAGERRSVRVPRGPDGRYVHRYEGVAESFALRAFAGRTWSNDARLNVVPRPTLGAVATRVFPPAYLSDLPPRELRPEEREFSALAGSRVEVAAAASPETITAFLPLREEKYVVVWNLDLRSARWWLADDFPSGSAPFGPWQFDWSRKHRRTHFTAPQDGETRYGVGFNPPQPVRADDVLVVHACLDPRHGPQQLLVEFNDGRSWDHRAWWGEDRLKRPEAKAAVRLGALPPLGVWTRLEIPAAAVGLAGKTVRELAFAVHGGRVRWDWFGACRGQAESQPAPGRERRIELAADSPGAWRGGFAVDLAERYAVELRDRAGHGNLAPESYRVRPLADAPPTVRIERPGKDILLARAAPVELAVACADDTGLAKAELLVTRQREAANFTRPLAAWTKPTTLETLRVALPLAEYDARPGDVFEYRARVVDRKGQVAESAAFKVTIQSADDAYDRQRERFEKKKQELTRQVKQLLEKQVAATERAAAIAQDHEPKPEEKPDAPPAAPPNAADAPQKPDQPPPDAKNPADAAEAPTGEKAAANAKTAVAKTAAQPAPANAKNAAPPKANANAPKAGEPAPLSPQERQELQKLAQTEDQLRGEAQNLGQQVEDALKSPDAQTASDNERQALQDARQELAKDAAPDLQAAGRELREAAKRPDDALQTQDAKAAAERAEQDLQRLADKLDKAEKIEELAKQDTDAARAEKALLEQQLAQEREAKKAADELAELQNRLGELRKEVGKEQTDQEKLAADAAQARDNQQLKQTENRQEDLEGKATETLKDVTDALGGQPPKALPASPEDAASQPMPAEPNNGEPATPPAQPGAEEKPAGKDAAGEPKPQGPMEGAAKAPGEGAKPDADGQPQDAGKPMGEGKDGQQPGTAAPDVPQFESLKKGAPNTREARAAAKKAQAGKSAEQRRDELGKRQDTLAQDLDLAANALDRRSGDLEKMMKALRGAASDPAAAKEMLQSQGLQKQLGAAQRAAEGDPKSLDRQMQARNQPGAPGGDRPGKGADGAAKAAGGELTASDLAKLKLQPREREELLQGSKAPTPESYKPFVRDYYNRLSEGAGK